MEKLLPEALRARFAVTLFTKHQGGLDVQLAAKLFRSQQDMSEMAVALMAARRATEEACLRRYIAFSKSEQAAAARQPTGLALWAGAAGGGSGGEAGATPWPAYAFHHPTDSLLHPTTANLTTAIKKLYAKLEPYLLGDLLRRAPGVCARACLAPCVLSSCTRVWPRVHPTAPWLTTHDRPCRPAPTTRC